MKMGFESFTHPDAKLRSLAFELTGSAENHEQAWLDLLIFNAQSAERGMPMSGQQILSPSVGTEKNDHFNDEP